MTGKASTGKEFEDFVELCISFACKKYGYGRKAQVAVGSKPGGGKHVVDWEIWDEEDLESRALVSCKMQSSGGTAEEKIPYEVIKLLHTIETDERYKFAWLVLGGNGWNPGLIDFYMNQLADKISGMAEHVKILRTDDLLSVKRLIP
jgi:hypothetical protein